MPKTPVNYSDTIFYKIVCRDLTITDLYVGHTTNFRLRKNQHKTVCNNANGAHYNLQVYTFIRDNGGWGNWEMILIHRQSCTGSLEAHTVERSYVETLCATLNCNMPSRTRREYYEDNKDMLKEKQILWDKKNEDKMKAYHILYKELNKENLKEKRRIHYLANSDIVKQQTALYREANKEAIKISKKIAYEKQKLIKRQCNNCKVDKHLEDISNNFV